MIYTVTVPSIGGDDVRHSDNYMRTAYLKTEVSRKIVLSYTAAAAAAAGFSSTVSVEHRKALSKNSHSLNFRTAHAVSANNR